MQDDLLILMDEYDDLLLKAVKSAADIERIECIEVQVIETFGPCGGMQLIQAAA